jgi:hypothetical protein
LGKEKTDAKNNVSSGAHIDASTNDLLSGFVQRRRDLRNYSKTELRVMAGSITRLIAGAGHGAWKLSSPARTRRTTANH